MAIHKFRNFLDDYQGIHPPEIIDPTENLYECKNCKSFFERKPTHCPGCGMKDFKIIKPRAKKEDESKTQTTGVRDIPREKKDKDVSIANPNIYRGPQ